MKIPCMYSIAASSFVLRLSSSCATHCCTMMFWKSEEWIARVEPCQQALAKGQRRNRWVADSSSDSHRGQWHWRPIPLFFRFSMVGKLSCNNLHTKVANPQRHFNLPDFVPNPILNVYSTILGLSRRIWVFQQNFICCFDLELTRARVFP